MCRGAKDQQFQKDVTADRISKLKEASIRRQDGLDQHLNLKSCADITIHRICVSTYTSGQHVSGIEKTLLDGTGREQRGETVTF